MKRERGVKSTRSHGTGITLIVEIPAFEKDFPLLIDLVASFKVDHKKRGGVGNIHIVHKIPRNGPLNVGGNPESTGMVIPKFPRKPVLRDTGNRLAILCIDDSYTSACFKYIIRESIPRPSMAERTLT